MNNFFKRILLPITFAAVVDRSWFGCLQVWKAEADDISGHHGLTRLVAVKTVKEGASIREREDLLREMAIMQQLGAHPNVVTLLGCCTDKGKSCGHMSPRG